MKKALTIIFLFVAMQLAAQSYSEQLAQTAIRIWPDSFILNKDKYARWRYDQGVILKGMESIWKSTGDAGWFDYIRKSMDFYVQDDGSIKRYRPDEYNIDHINNGKILLLLYQVTGKEKYKKAATLLRQQLLTHPRTEEGGFWHKKIYPSQMWLDGLYMAQPFYAEYAKLFGEDTAFNDIARQFVLMEQHARDPETGLLYHGWDASRQQQWADKVTGRSPHVWSRALGWFGMALVDVLDHFPKSHAGYAQLTGILNRFVKAVTSVQDEKTGLWYDIADMPEEPGNYFEASASSMLVYTLARGAQQGYIPRTYIEHARKGYNGILKEFIKTENGHTDLHGTVAVSGLGGKPYRDGSFEYYMSEPVVVNDPKGLGAFIKASVEMERLEDGNAGRGKIVLLDYYFNNEWKDGPSGDPVQWHYTWEDQGNGGFSILGNIFRRYGAEPGTISKPPSAGELAGASVYIMVDPDTKKETEKPNTITSSHADVISEWVKDGGVLILLGNDAGNADLEGFNRISSRFGIRLNEDNFNQVQKNEFEQGSVMVPYGNPVFKSAKKLYIKELATLQVNKPARTILEKEGKSIMAIANYGKGKVLVLGDPWLYNEYVDGRKLPTVFENFKAAEDLVRWALEKK